MPSRTTGSTLRDPHTRIPAAGPAIKLDPTYRAYALLIVTTACWGVNAVLGRLAVDHVSPMVLVSLRWFLVVVLLLSFAPRYIKQDWPLLRRHLPMVGAMAALGLAGFNSLFYTAAVHTTAVNIGILQGSIPVFVLLGVLVFYSSRSTVMQLVGVLVTVVGVVITASAGSLDRLLALSFNKGDLVMLCACALYAGYAVALRNKPKASALGLFTLMAMVAFMTSLPMLAWEVSRDAAIWPTTQGWVVVGLATLLPSLVSQVFFIKAVEMIGPSRAGVFVNLVPVFAALFAVLILGEAFKAYHGIALALVLGGIWISEKGKPAT